MDTQRRRFLKSGLVTGLLGLAASVGLLIPRLVWAAWPSSAFQSKTLFGALQPLFGSGSVNLTPADEDITLTVTDLAENGAVVPVTVSSRLPNVESITLLVDKNPNSLVAQFKLAKNTQAYIKTNIKMAETSKVYAVVKSGDKLYSTNKKVKVTLGGCGN
ncbi:MAG TPA: thiosulfate oxidation carrier protein SoxY [Gammaproteobacteria bacterium]|nr:thiosulfate oxidation carrier protein SoxY [Gammaproteobacteria bacterium]